MQRIGSRFTRGVSVLSVLAGLILLQTWMIHPPHAVTMTGAFFLAFYVILLLIAWVFPVHVGGQSVHVISGIVIPLFLQFDVVITIVVLFATWVVGQVITGHEMRWHRVLANASMFIMLTSLSSVAFFATGGKLGFSQPMWMLFMPITVFFIVHFVLNDAMTLMLTFLRDGHIDRWTVGVQWDLIAVIIDFFLAWLFILLGHDMNFLTFLTGGIAFLALMYMFRLYSNLVFSNQQLSTISAVTRQLSMELQEESLLLTLVRGVPQMVATMTCYVFEPQDDHLVAVSVYGPSAEVEKFMKKVQVEFGEGLTGSAYVQKEALMRRNRRDLSDVLEFEGNTPTPGNSILAIPLEYNHEVLGVLTLTHPDPNAYTKRDMEMVQILANQAAIGWFNARRFTQTKLETMTDSLTGTFNYRYFAMMIEQLCDATQRENEHLTLLVLDLDYFKQVNDSYGHLVGNEILQNVALVLKEHVREGDVVCRYGGEEFAVILPKTTLDIGMQVAERLRIAVEELHLPVRSKSSMAAKKGTVIPLRVTVSVGAATYPEQGDTAPTLILHADRAMYVGAKQKGRNRVSAYQSLSDA